MEEELGKMSSVTVYLVDRNSKAWEQRFRGTGEENRFRFDSLEPMFPKFNWYCSAPYIFVSM